MDDLIIIQDDREKKPFNFRNLPVEVETDRLETGDYTTHELRGIAAVERKSLDDLATSVTSNRDRFEAEVRRASEYDAFAVVIEHSRKPLQAYADRGETSCPLYWSEAYPRSITATVDSWSQPDKYDLDFYWLPDRDYAALKTYSLLTEWEAEIS